MKSTVRHLGIEVDGALETSKSIDIGIFRTAERRHSYQAGYELMDVFQSANRSKRTLRYIQKGVVLKVSDVP